MKAPVPAEEARRLETLRGYDVLDTQPESAFDDLTLFAAQICQVPIALISLVDENRQWFKSTIGLSATETSRDFAFCAHAILNPDKVLEVRDAQLDPRFADNPQVSAEPHIRFYAGAPLVTPDGFALGTLCVIDHVPRVLSAKQKVDLRALSRTVVAQLEQRRTLAAHRQTQAQLQSLNATLEQQVEARTAELEREMEVRRTREAELAQFKYTLDHALDGVYIFDSDTLRFVYVNQGAMQQVGYSEHELLRMTPLDIKPEFTEASFRAMLKPFLDRSRVAHTFETVHRHKDGHGIPVEIVLQLVPQGEQQASRYIVFSRDITARQADQAKIKRLADFYAALNQGRQAIVRCTSEDELFLQICRVAVRFGGMKMAWIGLVDEVSQLVKPVACYGTGTDYLQGIQISVNADHPFGRGGTGTAIRENRPVWHQDFRNEPSLAPWRERGVRSGWSAVAALPLTRRGQVIGALNLYADEVDAFNETVCNLLMEIARDIGHVLDGYSLQAERKQAEEEFRIAATAFESQQGMMITDANSVILRVNRAFTETTGYTAQEAVGQNPRLLQSGRHDKAFFAQMWQTLHATGEWHGEIWDRRRNGEIYPKWLTITAVKSENGVVTHYVGAHTDITARKAAEDEITLLAFYDPLTRLPNRRLLNDRLSQVMVAGKRSACYGALMFLDLDNFKPLNDVHGHGVGDLLLMEVANRLKSCVREVDTVARFGGDEFVVLLSDLNADKGESTSQAGSVAEKIRVTLSEPYLLTIKHQGRADTCVEYRCSVSIGVAMFIHDEASQDEILKRADVAMYQAKEAGRNLIRFNHWGSIPRPLGRNLQG